MLDSHTSFKTIELRSNQVFHDINAFFNISVQ